MEKGREMWEWDQREGGREGEQMNGKGKEGERGRKEMDGRGGRTRGWAENRRE